MPIGIIFQNPPQVCKFITRPVGACRNLADAMPQEPPVSELSIRIASLAKETNLGFFKKSVGSKFLRIYQIVGLFNVYRSLYIVKSKIYPFLKQSLAFLVASTWQPCCPFDVSWRWPAMQRAYIIGCNQNQLPPPPPNPHLGRFDL